MYLCEGGGGGVHGGEPGQAGGAVGAAQHQGVAGVGGVQLHVPAAGRRRRRGGAKHTQFRRFAHPNGFDLTHENKFILYSAFLTLKVALHAHTEQESTTHISTTQIKNK